MQKKELINRTKGELLEVAGDLMITGRHKMNKETLIDNIMKAQKSTARKKQKGKPERASSQKLDLPSSTQRIKEIVEKRWQQEVERTKFELFAAPYEPELAYPRELPQGYGETRITLMVRDPYWAYAYWEVTPQKLEQTRQSLNDDWHAAKTVLRVYDITGIAFNGHNANSYFDIEITHMANNWYINLGNPNRTYCVDIGIKTSKGDFHLLARSNTVTTPRAWMSEIIDEQWMSPQEDFERVYALSGGYRVGAGSLELQEIAAKRLQEQISSPGISSMASEVMPAQEKRRGFWFILDAELIIYGATEPDATVCLQGKQLPLRPDGTFSVRFALPDGQQVVPVTAESSDGIEIRRVVPTITRSTKRPAPEIRK